MAEKMKDLVEAREKCREMLGTCNHRPMCGLAQAMKSAIQALNEEIGELVTTDAQEDHEAMERLAKRHGQIAKDFGEK
jgi:hypothetical protein